jgi:hypothetical protein
MSLMQIKDLLIIKALMDADILCLKQTIEMIPVIIDKVVEFNGKVFSCRLPDAINERIKVYGSIFIIRHEYTSSKINFHPRTKNVHYTDSLGNTHCIYSEWYSAPTLYCDQVFEPQRVNAELIIPHLAIFDTACKEQIEKIKFDKSQLQEYLIERKNIELNIEKFNYTPKSNTGRSQLKITVRN